MNTYILLFSPGCPHCKNAVPHFTTAAELFKEDRKVSLNTIKEISSHSK